MREFITVIDILAAVGLIVLVLLQQGKGADMGAAFGSGASATLFGSRGTANFLTRTTAVLAAIFFVSNMALAYLSTQSAPSSVTGGSVVQEQAPSTPPDGSPAPAPTPKPGQVPEIPR